jgi:ElaB/YqjD/DUF883 family membrane-anchored ribosome-binding protein
MKAALLAALVAAYVSAPAAFGRAPLAAQGSRLTGDPKMDARLRASRAEREHQELLDDATELVKLSGELSKSLEDRNNLDSEDGKKLERIRKLAKRVRSTLGASGDPAMEHAPATMHAAATALGERSKDLATQIETSNRFQVNTRMVVAATDIWVLSDILWHFRGSR